MHLVASEAPLNKQLGTSTGALGRKAAAVLIDWGRDLFLMELPINDHFCLLGKLL